jgi:hypothetical protein
MKGTWPILLLLLLLAEMRTAQAQFTCTTNAGVITITGYSGAGGVVNIPVLINNLPVTSIGEGVFSNFTSLTSATLPNGVSNLGNYAFDGCSNLTGIYFAGNAPSANSNVFSSDTNAKVYYLPHATGWTSPFAGLPAVVWNPLIQTSNASFGVQSNQFGFDIAGPTNSGVAVEASTNLASSGWTPLQTFTLTNGLAYFSETLQMNSSGRYYGLGFPSTNQTSAVSTLSPVLRWKMNEGSGTTTADSSGNGYTGTLSGVPLPVWITTSASLAGFTTGLSCDANRNRTTYAYLTGNANVSQLGGAQHASIACWIYQANAAEGDTGDSATAGFSSDLTASNEFTIDYDSDENLFYIFATTGGVTVGGTVSGGFVYPYGIFEHCVLTFDGTQSTQSNQLLFYVDGAAQTISWFTNSAVITALPSASALGYPTLAFGFGGNNSDNPVPASTYGGAYSDMQVFGVTLTPAQVNTIYNAGAQ